MIAISAAPIFRPLITECVCLCDGCSSPSGRDLRMTDFRLLRHGGFYHAVAGYGEDVWAPFIDAGLHATERVLRRKEEHRLWGVEAYVHGEDRHLRIANRCSMRTPNRRLTRRLRWWSPSTPGRRSWPGGPWTPPLPP